MFLFLCVQTLSQRNIISLKGQWEDTSIIDETIAFIKSYSWESFGFIMKQLNSYMISSRESLIHRLQPVIPNYLLSLLDFGLYTRYFHPQAVIHHSIKGTKGTFRGWGIRHMVNSIDYSVPRLCDRVFSALLKLESMSDRVDFLKELSHDYSSYHEVISQFEIDESSIELFKKNHFNDSLTIQINGRYTEGQYYSIVDGIYDEYKYYYLLRDMNNVSIEVYNEICFTDSTFDLIYKTDEPKLEICARPLQYLRQKNLRINIPNIHNMKIENALKLLAKDISINIYVSLSSNETLSLLKFVFDMEKQPYPLDIRVFFCPTLNNQTEEEIALGFLYIAWNIGQRNAVQFLYEGILYGFPKAYKNVYPELKWSSIKELIIFDNYSDSIREIQKYSREKELRGADVSINGQFIDDLPVFYLLKQKIEGYIVELYSSSSSEITQEHVLYSPTAYRKFKVSVLDYISLDDFTAQEIQEALKEIMTGEIIKHGNPSDPILLLINSDYENLPENLTIISLSRSGPATKKLFRLTSSSCIILFPLVFRKKISSNDLFTSIEYVRQYYLNLESVNLKLSIYQRIIVSLWQGDNKLRGIHRSKENYNFSAIEYPRKAIHIHINTDISSSCFPEVMDIISTFINKDVGSLSIALAPPKDPSSYPQYFSYKFSIPNDKGEIVCDCDNYQVVYPYNNWAVQKVSKNEYIVQSIYSEGFSPGYKSIQFGRLQLSVFPINGYFPLNFPIGKHPFFNVDSFVPRRKTVSCEEVNMVERDDSLHIITYVNSHASFAGMSSMNKSGQVHFHIFATEPLEIPSNSKCELIPLFVPSFFRHITDPDIIWQIQKLILPGLTLPLSASNVLVSDSDIFWNADPGLFHNLDMKTSVIAAQKSLTHIFKEYKRPYHSASFIWYDLVKFREDKSIIELFNIFNILYYADYLPHDNGEYLLNHAQMKIQVLTLYPSSLYKEL